MKCYRIKATQLAIVAFEMYYKYFAALPLANDSFSFGYIMLRILRNTIRGTYEKRFSKQSI